MLNYCRQEWCFVATFVVNNIPNLQVAVPVLLPSSHPIPIFFSVLKRPEAFLVFRWWRTESFGSIAGFWLVRFFRNSTLIGWNIQPYRGEGEVGGTYEFVHWVQQNRFLNRNLIPRHKDLFPCFRAQYLTMNIPPNSQESDLILIIIPFQE